MNKPVVAALAVGLALSGCGAPAPLSVALSAAAGGSYLALATDTTIVLSDTARIACDTQRAANDLGRLLPRWQPTLDRISVDAGKLCIW